MKLLAIGVAALALSGCIVVKASPDDLFTTSFDDQPPAKVESLDLRGGLDIVIRQGDRYGFENTGTSEGWKVGYKGDTMVIECDNKCRKSGNVKATVTMPRLENLSVKGGGEVVVEGSFPETNELNISLVGGGEIDTQAVRGREVNVSIVGGGEIDVTALDELNVSIVGGGEINYRGSPEVHRSVIGGGEVTRVG